MPRCPSTRTLGTRTLGLIWTAILENWLKRGRVFEYLFKEPWFISRWANLKITFLWRNSVSSGQCAASPVHCLFNKPSFIWTNVGHSAFLLLWNYYFWPQNLIITLLWIELVLRSNPRPLVLIVCIFLMFKIYFRTVLSESCPNSTETKKRVLHILTFILFFRICFSLNGKYGTFGPAVDRFKIHKILIKWRSWWMLQ